MTFLNAEDVEALRDHILDIKERSDQILRILNRGKVQDSITRQNKGKIIPDGVWKDDLASQRQINTLQKANIEIWDGITKGEASKLIEDLFRRNKK